jgi:hypothetical protein
VRALILLAAVPSLFAQAAPAPVYTRESIRPGQGGDSKILAPGMVVEVYGQHLAPEPWCGASRTPPSPYPAELCGVRVLVGPSPAGLMYVGPAQINFTIPANAPAAGSAPIQVCVSGVCGAPVTMQFAARKAFLRPRGAAYVHMPVWIDVYQTTNEPVRYPCRITPWSFNGYRFEVRRNGQTVSPIPQAAAANSASPGGCWDGAVSGRLPLHLLYDMDQPGTYSVRFTATRREGPTLTVVSQSDWTDIGVAAPPASARDEWLQSMAEKAQSASPRDLITDVIPSLLAWPDDKALAILRPLAGRPAPKDASDQMGLAGQFARASLGAFDDATLRRVIPPDQLLNFCPPDGRCHRTN